MSTIQLNVNLNLQQLVETVKKLSPKEKMLINDAIWEENMDVPAEHKELVLDRIKKARKNPERLVDWNDAMDKLRP